MNSDRIREIQEETAYPDSVSVKTALLQVWNECQQESNSFARSQAIEFKNWVKSLPPTSLVTVHPPAGSGGSTGIYLIPDDELYFLFLAHQAKQSNTETK